jgi:hypothetical protein
MRAKYKRPEFIMKQDMRREMRAVASDLRRASQESHETLREWALNAAEVLEVMGSGPTLRELVVWALIYSLAGYGVVTLFSNY